MVFPNLFIAGVPKAATTSLSDVLRLGSEFYVPKEKEPHYFAFPNVSPQFSGPADNEIFRSMIVHQRHEYTKLYDGVGCKWRVDASTMYLYLGGAIAEILKEVPDAKFILLFRDPAERAFSAYQHMRRDAREPLDSFRDALCSESRRISEGWSPIWHYLAASCYGHQLKAFKELVPEGNYLILHQEWMYSQPNLFSKKISDFLCLNFDMDLLRGKKSNVSGEPKSKFIGRILSRPGGMKTFAKMVLGDDFSRFLKEKARSYNFREKLVLDDGLREKIYGELDHDMKIFLSMVDHEYLPSWTSRFLV
ncbi:Uncharacterised protein [Zhongshania aliphaticivorans]|uniref:Sulfotransferase domain-containing protein n=1 Tax=Zhongshania aliphaticivorans TaxID=1470434 RepID=A0A5S9PMX9_9GAMM|nr:sulfotransferase [Zhongshania aliphaticivorans]CAA0105615.1 Uncharacterised protein [Zhongshania aliphaticivorans]CAA0105873.1 Uncharacterised protein [Zhongshania aliphaticivorans]